jgi:hypothetical protein
MTVRNRNEIFETGEKVSLSGHYKVFHKAHVLSSEIALLNGRSFPACAQCKLPVHFRLKWGVPVESASERYRLLQAK